MHPLHWKSNHETIDSQGLFLEMVSIFAYLSFVKLAVLLENLKVPNCEIWDAQHLIFM